MSKSLFAIGADLVALDALVEESIHSIGHEEGCETEYPAAQAAFDAWATELDTDQSNKVDGYRAMIRKWESELAVAKSLEDQYRKERKTRENRIAWLKSRMQAYMEGRGIDRITTDTLGEVRIQKNGGVQELQLDQVDWSSPELRDWARCEYVPNKEAIRKMLETTDTLGDQCIRLTFARLLPRTKSLRIK